jgi:hypothetical protein
MKVLEEVPLGIVGVGAATELRGRRIRIGGYATPWDLTTKASGHV